MPSNLPLGDEFEPGPVQVIAFETAFRRRGIGQQDLENAVGNSYYAFVFAYSDAELDKRALGIPSGVRREGLARDAVYLLRPDTYVALADPSGAPEALDRYFSDQEIQAAPG